MTKKCCNLIAVPLFVHGVNNFFWRYNAVLVTVQYVENCPQELWAAHNFLCQFMVVHASFISEMQKKYCMI